MVFTLEKIKQVMDKVIKDAYESDAFNGKMGYGLGGDLEKQLKFFILGAKEIWTHEFEIPKEWIDYFKVSLTSIIKH